MYTILVFGISLILQPIIDWDEPTGDKLILNVSKTNFMVFGNSKQRNTILQVSIKNSKIKRVYVTKFLGILIDDRLNWKELISLICSKLSKCIAIMYKAKHLLDKDSLVMLYDSLFVPYLSYCSEILGNTYKTNINCVYVLPKESTENCVQCGLSISLQCII